MFVRYDFERIKAFYAAREQAILAAPKNEWAFHPYEWDDVCGISLTPIEEAMWSDIRTCDLVMYPQYPAHGFFLDFANPKAKVCIECDGAAYHVDRERDRQRDAILSSHGWHVYRISGADCRRSAMAAEGERRPTLELARQIAEWHGIARMYRIHV